MIVSDFMKDTGRVRHGFFTRQGGVSGGIYESLNCGFGSKDNPDNVRENRARVSAKLGVEPQRLLTVHQIHSNTAILADKIWDPGEAPQGDALVTAVRGLAVGVLSADCTPILFAETTAGIVGAAHAGWRGAKSGIIEAVLDAMDGLGGQRDRICAAIGPTISQPSYEVSHDFKTGFLEEDSANEAFFTTSPESGKPHFDLPGYCRAKLERAGVRQIESSGQCTFEDESLFFSYRRSLHGGEQDYGRQISAIVLM